MSVMNIDFDKLRIILLPHVLRQCGLLGGLLTAMYVPLKRCYAAFVRYMGTEEREREYGPTVHQLRAALAYHLGIDASLVLIGDVANRDVIDLRRQSDEASTRVELGNAALTLWSDDMVWWNREFAVSLPGTYLANEAEVKAILDRWKMAASRYTIIYR